MEPKIQKGISRGWRRINKQLSTGAAKTLKKNSIDQT